MYKQSAAMFGLDARIALVIFGALSVISGAALYSTIQNSKATAILTEMKEVSKAFEAYYLDTGSKPPASGNSTNSEKHEYDVEELTTSTVTGWNGPYINYEVVDGRNDALNHPVYTYIYIMSIREGTSWGDTIPWNTGGFCDGTSQCYDWVTFSGISFDLAKAIDVIVDGEDSPTTGSFKYVYWSNDSCDVMLKIMPADDIS